MTDLFKDIAIPRRMTTLRRLPSGMPVPRFASWDEGKPNFAVMDADFAKRAIRHKLCFICAEKLGRTVAFVGGPKSEATGYYTEPPFHRDCAEFAMQVCPYVLTGNNSRSAPVPENLCKQSDPNNPVVFAMVLSDYFMWLSDAGCFSVSKKEVVWYKHGRLATQQEIDGAKAAAQAYIKALEREKAEKEAARRAERQNAPVSKRTRTSRTNTMPRMALHAMAASMLFVRR